MSEWVDLRGEGELLARLNLHTLELAIMGRRGRLFCCDIVASVAAQRPVIERLRVSEGPSVSSVVKVPKQRGGA